MLPENRAAAAGPLGGRPVHDQASRHEEAGVKRAIHELHDARGFERREGEQEQEGGDELRPDEKWQAHPRHARRAELDDRGDEIHRAER